MSKYLTKHAILFFNRAVITRENENKHAHNKSILINPEGLDSIIYQPQASYGDKEFYPDIYAKTAYVFQQAIKKTSFSRW